MIMELDELKSAWSSYTEKQTNNNVLSVEEIENMLGKRTHAISDKIRRNIRIGVIIMLCWVVVSFGADIITTIYADPVEQFPELFTRKMMLYASLFEAFLYVLLFVAIILFWHRFRIIEKRERESIKETVVFLINIISSYKRMFYFIFMVFLVYISIVFGTGFYAGFTSSFAESGISMSQLGKTWILVALIFMFFLALMIAIYYVLFSFFFNRLYGRYLKQLKSTLEELESI